MEDLPPTPRISHAQGSYKASEKLPPPLPAPTKPSRLRGGLWGCGCSVLVLLPLIACIAALLLGPWVYGLFNPPFVLPANAQQCGSIEISSGLAGNDAAAKQCFWRAYQACRAAVLTVTFSGVDAYVIHNFVLEKQANQCNLSDYVQGSDPNERLWEIISVHTRDHLFGIYHCQGLQQVGNGLRFVGCGSFGTINLDIPPNNLKGDENISTKNECRQGRTQ